MAGHGSQPGERRGGRKPGTPNKSTLKAREVLQQHAPDWDPLKFHIDVAMGKKRIQGKTATLDQRLAAADKVLRRCYPEMKSVDMVGSIEGSIELVWKE